MIPTNLNRLKELAEAATPGPWFNQERFRSIYAFDGGGDSGLTVFLAKVEGHQSGNASADANAAYIAAASPDVVLRLIEERMEMVRALRAWAFAMATGRHEPLIIAEEQALALLAKLEEQGL